MVGWHRKLAWGVSALWNNDGAQLVHCEVSIRWWHHGDDGLPVWAENWTCQWPIEMLGRSTYESLLTSNPTRRSGCDSMSGWLTFVGPMAAVDHMVVIGHNLLFTNGSLQTKVICIQTVHTQLWCCCFSSCHADTRVTITSCRRWCDKWLLHCSNAANLFAVCLLQTDGWMAMEGETMLPCLWGKMVSGELFISSPSVHCLHDWLIFVHN